MGITQLNLPPIPLHASTQMDNRTPEKVKFLKEAEMCIRDMYVNWFKKVLGIRSVRHLFKKEVIIN